MVLCDTNVFIYAFNSDTDTLTALDTIGYDNIILSSITAMELYQGMGNKGELQVMKKKIKYYDVLQIDTLISERAIELIDQYNLSHGLTIPDAIIGAWPPCPWKLKNRYFCLNPATERLGHMFKL